MEKIPFGKFGFIHVSTVEWVKAHLTYIAGGIAVCIVGVLAVSRWSTGNFQVDYMTADAVYNKWEGKQGEVFSKLQKILKRHPELHAKYDGAIAQKLLGSSESGLAAGYGKAMMKRMGDFSPYYSDFSTCSLLIGENKLKEALDQAKNLKSSMETDADFWEKKSDLVRHGCILFAYNLLRIAMLESAAGTPEGELTAWRQFKENTGKTYDLEAYNLIQENFQTQELSLSDYIAYREAVISSESERP